MCEYNMLDVGPNFTRAKRRGLDVVYCKYSQYCKGPNLELSCIADKME